MSGTYHGNPMAKHLPLPIDAGISTAGWRCSRRPRRRSARPSRPGTSSSAPGASPRASSSASRSTPARGLRLRAQRFPEENRHDRTTCSPRQRHRRRDRRRPAGRDRRIPPLRPGFLLQGQRGTGRIRRANAASTLADVERALAALDSAVAGGAAPDVDAGADRPHPCRATTRPIAASCRNWSGWPARSRRSTPSEPDVPRGLGDLLERMSVELQQHMAKEELILFPAIAVAGRRRSTCRSPHAPRARRPRRASARARRADRTASPCRPTPAGPGRRSMPASPSWSDDLMEHIHLENNVLFPRFSAVESDAGFDGSLCGRL